VAKPYLCKRFNEWRVIRVIREVSGDGRRPLKLKHFFPLASDLNAHAFDLGSRKWLATRYSIGSSSPGTGRTQMQAAIDRVMQTYGMMVKLNLWRCPSGCPQLRKRTGNGSYCEP
jgi:hypothetical protein